MEIKQPLIGQDACYNSLYQARQRGKLAHGLLLTGTQGSGKATLARQIAAWLLHGDQAGDGFALPPATAKVWALLQAGAHPDCNIIVPDDGKASISADQIRALQQFASGTSSLAAVKVAIIDSADQLTANAANALLKLLEEPIGDMYLLLISHQPAGLLPTIRSRCQNVYLKPLSVADFAAVLRRYDADMPIGQISQLHAATNGAPGLALNVLDDMDEELRIALIQRVDNINELPWPVLFDYAAKVKSFNPATQMLATRLLLAKIHTALEQALPNAALADLAAAAEQYQKLEADWQQGNRFYLDSGAVIYQNWQTAQRATQHLIK